jgi:hypothetical protein
LLFGAAERADTCGSRCGCGCGVHASQVEFLLAAGPSEPLRPLSAVASGGESARVMLALKAAPAQLQQQQPAAAGSDEAAGAGGSQEGGAGPASGAGAAEEQLTAAGEVRVLGGRGP